MGRGLCLCVYTSRVGSPNYLCRLVVLCPDSEKSLKIHPSAWKGNSANYFAWDAFCDSLRVFSDSAAIVRLFGARRLSQQAHPFFPEPPKRCLPRIYEGIPQVDCLLALSCSRRTCGDEFPMNSTKQLHGFPPSAWKELSENSGFRSSHSPGRVPPDRTGALIHTLGSLCTTTTCRASLTRREWPQKVFLRLWEGVLCGILQALLSDALTTPREEDAYGTSYSCRKQA